MADQRLTDKDLLTDPVGADLMHVVDVSDTTGSVAGTSKQITLSSAVVAGAGAPANEIIINAEADFAVQTATTITLEADKVYIPGASLVTSKQFIPSTNVEIRCRNLSVLWEYTGTGNMFDGMNVESFQMSNISLRATNAAQLFNFIDTTPLTSSIKLENIFGNADASSLICEKVATFTNLSDVTLKDLRMDDGLGFNSGITFAGTQASPLIFDNVIILSLSPTFIGLDFGNAVFNALPVEALQFHNFLVIGVTPGSVGISGLANSANILSNHLATFNNCQVLGTITALNGITENDIRYRFRNSFGIPDSTIDFFASMTVAQTVTIINQNVFVPIAGGNWVDTKSNRWSIDTDGVATFLVEQPTDVKLEANCSLLKSGGGTNLLAMRINVDTGSGFPVSPPARTQSETENDDIANITSVDIITINEDDRVRIEVANFDSTDDIIISANARFLSPNAF